MISLVHFLRFGSFAHELLRGRDIKGRSIDVCTLCGYTRVVLAEAVIMDGPAHQQVQDLGARTMTAKIVRGPNVREWKRSER